LSRSILIDCDPGLDDAVAIALAGAAPSLDIGSICTVAGNAPIRVVTRNALALSEALGCGAPVYQGSDHPLVLPPRYSTDLWGGDGDLGLPPSIRTVRGDAVGHLAATLASAAPGSLTLCALGPLTNLARLLDASPTAPGSVERLVVMGGALGRGNATPHSELNIWCDPHAAARVLAADWPVTLIPLDLTRLVRIGPRHLEALTRSSVRAARLCARLLPLSGANSHPSSIHDACVIGWLLWPDLFALEEGEVAVATEGEELGRTRFEPGRGGRHRVATRLEVETFLDRLVATLCGEGS
jgi:purine nucleosidase